MHLHSHKSDHNYDCRNALPMYDLLTRFFDTFSWHVPFLFLRQRMSPSPYVSLEYQESVPYDRMVHHQRLNKLSFDSNYCWLKSHFPLHPDLQSETSMSLFPSLVPEM